MIYNQIKITRFFFLFCVALIPIFSFATNDWNNSKWIWLEEDGEPNSWVAFRKNFRLESVPEDAIATIAVDTKYWLWVNGEMVIFEGGLTRGAAPQSSYYDEVDLKKYLQKGENNISILVWYWGRTRKTHEDSGKGGLLFYSDMNGHKLESDNSWKIKKHPAYDTKSEGGGNSANRINAYNVRFNANQAMGDWSNNAWYSKFYDDMDWDASSVKGEANAMPWAKLVKRPIPEWNDRGLADYVSLSVNGKNISLPYKNNSDKIVRIYAKLPFNRQLTPYLKIISKSRDTIVINSDDNFNLIKSIYIARKGEQEFEGYSWFNGHNIEYDIPSGMEVVELKYRWTGVGEMKGEFECSDNSLTRLWWMARNTLYICARDSYMDCPDRERGLWIGDVADQTGAVFYTLDEAGRKLLKKAIDNTIAYKNGDTIQGLAPGFGAYRGKSSELTGQSLQFIDQCIWQYYFNTGDIKTLRNAYPAVMAYMNLWTMMPDGMPIHRKGYANWVDWGIDTDPVATNVVLYYMALKAVRNMAMVLNNNKDVEWCESRIKSIKNNFEKKYWRGSRYATINKPVEERTSALAVMSGLASEKHYQVLADSLLFPVRKASPHMEWMADEALILTGNCGMGLNRMKERYASQIDNLNLTTLYEKFDDKRPGTPNHAWNAPNYVLSHFIAGIRPTEVAWSKFEVKPLMTSLTQVYQKVPTVKGDIIMKANKQHDSSEMLLDSPSKTSAMVYIPVNNLKGVKSVTLNNKLIWKSGKLVNNYNGMVEYINICDNYICFEINGGKWNFLVK